MNDLHVVCAILCDGELVLAAQRGFDRPDAEKWEFPGGKIELGESPETALKREIREELNVEIEILKPLALRHKNRETGSLTLYPFCARIASGRLEAREHLALRWGSPKALRELDWLAGDRHILEQLVTNHEME